MFGIATEKIITISSKEQEIWQLCLKIKFSSKNRIET